MTLYFGDLLPYMPLLLNGLWTGFYITVVAMLVGSAFGVVLYLGKASPVRFLRVFSSGYIEAFRNTPLLVQLYLIYFGLPQLGVNVGPVWAALIGLTLNNAAYTAEIYRAGFEAVPRGLREAANALGMRHGQTVRYVLLAPATHNVFPALTNQFILLFLASSIGSIISLPELTSEIMNVSNTTFRTIEALAIGGLLYFVVSALMAVGSRVAEQKLFGWAARTDV